MRHEVAETSGDYIACFYLSMYTITKSLLIAAIVVTKSKGNQSQNDRTRGT